MNTTIARTKFCDEGITIGALLAAARPLLAAASFAPPAREAALLLGRVLGISQAQLLARAEELVPTAARHRFEALLERRLSGEPVAYLFGEREFYGRLFEVDRRVLVPRPETEHLVEAALTLTLPPMPRILDIGTGSGAIAVTLAAEISEARLVATDLSPAALAVARANARRHGVAGRVALLATDLAAALALAGFDLVVSNPPYVDPSVAPELSLEVRDFEPSLALFAPENGRAVLRRLVALASALRPGVALIVEIGHDQASWLRETVRSQRELELVEIRTDYSGIPRTAVLRRRGAGPAPHAPGLL